METTPTESPKPKAKAKPRGKRARPTASAVKVEDASTALVATRGRGRPPRAARTEEIEEIILERLRDGETLRDICKSAGMPREAFVREWAAEVGAPFAELFRRAREIGYHKLADEILAIADAKDGDPQWARLQIDSRKFILSKMLPKIFGDKLEVEAKAGLVILKLDAEDLAL